MSDPTRDELRRRANWIVGHPDRYAVSYVEAHAANLSLLDALDAAEADLAAARPVIDAAGNVFVAYAQECDWRGETGAAMHMLAGSLNAYHDAAAAVRDTEGDDRT